MLFPGGMILSSESDPPLRSTLAEDAFTPWKTFTISEDVVVPLGMGGDDGEGSAALTYYRVVAEREGVLFKAVCSSVWRMEGEGNGDGAKGWRMVSHQQTLA